MPRKLHHALTPITVKNAGPGRHADGGGLYLRVKTGGARSWIFRAIVAGKAQDIGLGPAAGAKALSLAEARTKAKELSAKVEQGEQVQGKRAAARQAAATAKAEAQSARTFKEFAEEFITLKEDGWKNEKHRSQWRNTLDTYAYPVIGDLPLSQIETEHVLKVLEPIWLKKPETARRVRGRIETVLAAAKVMKLRSGENPAMWRGHLDHLLPTRAKVKRHHPALHYSEIPAFMTELRAKEALSARALEFAILTATRSNEVLEATWGEVDIAAGKWTIPADRMKAEKVHEVPLSAGALAVLKEVEPLNTKPSKDAPLFPTRHGDPISNMAMLMLLRRMHDAATEAGGEGWIDRQQGGAIITVHGFRSTFRDWAGEQTPFPREVVEHALAHQLPDKTEAAYSRATLLPKRAKLMEAWAAYCAQPVGGAVVLQFKS